MAVVLIVGNPSHHKLMEVIKEYVYSMDNENIAYSIETTKDAVDTVLDTDGFTDSICIIDGGSNEIVQIGNSDAANRINIVKVSAGYTDISLFNPIFDLIKGRQTTPLEGWIKDDIGWWYRYPPDFVFNTMSGMESSFVDAKIHHDSISSNDLRYLEIDDDEGEDRYYFFNANTGYLVTGWIKIEEGYYYLKPYAVTGLVEINGKYHYFSPSGIAASSMDINGETVLLLERGELPDSVDEEVRKHNS